MDLSKIDNYLLNLEGISYFDWIKLQLAINANFESKKCELEKELKLTNVKSVSNIIHSQFE